MKILNLIKKCYFDLRCRYGLHPENNWWLLSGEIFHKRKTIKCGNCGTIRNLRQKAGAWFIESEQKPVKPILLRRKK
jgi:hypothetical protein